MRGSAGVEEGLFGVGEFGFVAGSPFVRGGEAGAAVQVGGVAAALVPVACAVAQVVVQAAAVGVLFEPVA